MGAIDKGNTSIPLAGTPQGGIISPQLANWTLSGLEEVIKKSVPRSRNVTTIDPISNEKVKKKSQRKVNVVRYADDFVVTVDTLKDAKIIKNSINDFLKERGLELNKDKTSITDVTNGFDFLGVNFRVHGDRGLLLTPSSKSIEGFKLKIRSIIKKRQNAAAGLLIKELNPIIKG